MRPSHYLAKNIPNVTFRETLVIDKGDGVVTELVCLDVGGRGEAEAVVLAHQLYERLLRAGLLLVADINIVTRDVKQSRASDINHLSILTKVF